RGARVMVRDGHCRSGRSTCGKGRYFVTGGGCMERTARSRKGSNWANEAMGTSPKGGGQPGWSPLPGKRRKTGDASAFRNQQKCRSCFRYRGSRSWVDLMNAAGTSKDMIKPHVWS